MTPYQTIATIPALPILAVVRDILSFLAVLPQRRRTTSSVTYPDPSKIHNMNVLTAYTKLPVHIMNFVVPYPSTCSEIHIMNYVNTGRVDAPVNRWRLNGPGQVEALATKTGACDVKS
jgi:hypothetical protein